MSNMNVGLKFTATTSAAIAALSGVEKTLGKLKHITETLTQKQKDLGRAIATAPLSATSLKSLNKDYEKLGQTIEKLQVKQIRLNQLLDKRVSLKNQREDLKGQIVGAVATGAAIFLPVKLAIDFESAMADVKKVVDFKTPEGFQKLSDELLDLTRILPMAAGELAQIAASGGQLGVAEEDIKSFTTTIAKMGVAFDMSADEAGDSMAKLANVYNIPITELSKLGDAINELSNTSPAKANDFVNTLRRVGGVAKQFGLTEFAAASLSNTFIAMGKTPEVAGTAINSMLTKLMTVEQQGKGFQAALKDMGVSAKDLQKDIKNNAEGALVSFLEKINKLPKEKQMGVLVGLFGMNFADDVALLSGNIDQYKKSIEQLQAVGENGQLNFIGSMEKEFQARAATTQNSWQLLKNGLSELGITVGAVLLPQVNELLSTIKPLINSVVNWARENPKVTQTLMRLATVLAASKIGFLAARFGINSFKTALNEAKIVANLFQSQWLMTKASLLAPGITKNISGFGKVFSSIGKNALTFGKALVFGDIIKGFSMAGKAVLGFSKALLLSPITWIIAGIALAAFLIYKYWNPIKAYFKGVFNGIRDAFLPVQPMFDKLATTFKPVIDFFKELFSVEQVAAGGAESFGYKVGTVVGNVLTAVVTIGSMIVDGWSMIFEGLFNIVGSAWGEIETAFDGGLTGVLALIINWSPIGAFYSAFAAVLSWFGIELPAKFTGFGTMIMDGLLNGIKTGANTVLTYISDIGTKIKTAFAGIMGIKSPSRVFMGYGVNMIEGLNIGLAKSAPKAENQIKSLSDRLGINPDANGSINIGGGSSGGGMVINFQPTINAPGGDPNQIQEAMRLSLRELEVMLKQLEFDRARRSFS